MSTLKTIVLLNPKGGAGKSTTAMHLSNTLAYYYDKEVLLSSTDRQQSPTKIRKLDIQTHGDSEKYYEIMGTNSEYFYKEVLPDRKGMESEGLEFLIVDSPGYVDPYNYVTALKADLVLIPVELTSIGLTEWLGETIHFVKDEIFKTDPTMFDKTFWFGNKMDKRDSSYTDFVENHEFYASQGVQIMPGIHARAGLAKITTASFPDIKDTSTRPMIIEFANNVLERLGVEVPEVVSNEK